MRNAYLFTFQSTSCTVAGGLSLPLHMVSKGIGDRVATIGRSTTPLFLTGTLSPTCSINAGGWWSGACVPQDSGGAWGYTITPLFEFAMRAEECRPNDPAVYQRGSSLLTFLFRLHWLPPHRQCYTWGASAASTIETQRTRHCHQRDNECVQYIVSWTHQASDSLRKRSRPSKISHAQPPIKRSSNVDSSHAVQPSSTPSTLVPSDILEWTDAAFSHRKDPLAAHTLLVHPTPDAPTCVKTDASNGGAVLQQHSNTAMVTGAPLRPGHSPSNISVRADLIDHNPLIYALSARTDLYSPRQVRHLDFIAPTFVMYKVHGTQLHTQHWLCRSSSEL